MLRLRVQAAGIEHAVGIEALLEAAMDFHQRRGQRREHAAGPLFPMAAAEQRGMAARGSPRFAHAAFASASPRSQRCAPPHSITVARQIQRRRHRGQRQPPQRRIAGEEGRRLLAQSLPEVIRRRLAHRFATEHGAGRAYRRLRAGQADGQHAVLPALATSGSGCRPSD
jgi:hypothetical protein